jgi:acetylornithine deacetylase
MLGATAPEFVRSISDAVDARRDDLVALLLRLVGTPSVTGSEGPVQGLVEQELRSRGLEIDRWEAEPEQIEPYVEHVGRQDRYDGRPNLVGRWVGTGGGRSLLLNAHVDTVEIGDRSAWRHDPAGEVVGDLVYGRGSCDMKGGLVAFIGAVDALRSLGVRPQGDLLLNTTVGEENGGLGALSTVLRGYRADAAVIAEPTRLALVPAQGGSLVFRLTVTGRAAHAAVRDQGVSALDKFLLLYQELTAFEVERNRLLRHPLYEHLTNKVPVNVGVVRGGVWPSTVPEHLVAEGRIGLLPGEEVASIRREVERRLAAIAERDQWLREHPPHVEWFSGQFAPVEVPVDAAICQAIARAHEAVSGAAPVVQGVPYGADMRLFILFGSMPCVMYGPGDVTVAHRADEHVAITELLQAAKTFAVLIADWCGVTGP